MSQLPQSLALCPRCRVPLIEEAIFCHRCGAEVCEVSSLSTEMLTERAKLRSVELMSLLKETVRRSPPLVGPIVVFILDALQRVLAVSPRTRPLGLALGLAIRAARSLL